MKISLAFKAFFAALFKPSAAVAIQKALESNDIGESAVSASKSSTSSGDRPASTVTRSPKSMTTASNRSDALTVLAALQREARFLDLIQEPLTAYSDAQVGAAARDVLRDSNQVLQRMFAIKPLVDIEEGAMIDLDDKPNASRVKIVGSKSSNAKQATVLHQGWVATTTNIPIWTGDPADQMVLMPTEVE